MSDAHFDRYIKPRVRVDESTGCWLWTKAKTRSGYGKATRFDRSITAHRLSFALTHGPIPDGMCVCHRCDTPACVNPDHLFLGTNAENTADRDAKGRTARGERQGLAKLCAADVVAIRLRCANGERRSGLAREYGVCKTTIDQVVQRRIWRHVKVAA